MKITLKEDKSIRGSLTKAGTTIDVGDEVAQILIDCGCAAKCAAKTKKTTKSED